MAYDTLILELRSPDWAGAVGHTLTREAQRLQQGATVTVVVNNESVTLPADLLDQLLRTLKDKGRSGELRD